MKRLLKFLGRWVECKNCSGTGQKNGKTCTACNGRGGQNTSTI